MKIREINREVEMRRERGEMPPGRCHLVFSGSPCGSEVSCPEKQEKRFWGDPRCLSRPLPCRNREREREIRVRVRVFSFPCRCKRRAFFFSGSSAKSDREGGFSNRAEGTGRCKQDPTWEWIGLKEWPSLFFFWGPSQVAGPHGTRPVTGIAGHKLGSPVLNWSGQCSILTLAKSGRTS